MIDPTRHRQLAAGKQATYLLRGSALGLGARAAPLPDIFQKTDEIALRWTFASGEHASTESSASYRFRIGDCCVGAAAEFKR
jgi:hypothetical protein